jgi:hypothetical protein
MLHCSALHPHLAHIGFSPLRRTARPVLAAMPPIDVPVLQHTQYVGSDSSSIPAPRLVAVWLTQLCWRSISLFFITFDTLTVAVLRFLHRDWWCCSPVPPSAVPTMQLCAG